jgi:hypothetical protein
MQRAIVSRKTLDSLIRAKLATMPDCSAIEALPVTWQERHAAGCNWTIPGWVGESSLVAQCRQHLEHYLAFLQAQFDISAQDFAD